MEEILLRLRWQDVVDILLISFIIHRLYLLFRHTQAFQIIVGLLFLWLLHFVAQAMGLVFTTWFLQGSSAVIILIGIVVFRNEIREILIQTSPVRLFWGSPSLVHQMNFASVADAVFGMAGRRVGAILVFERRDRLNDRVKSGVESGGNYTTELMETVFTPKSPLHDGAMIIRGGRIKRMGGILPLSTRLDLPIKYGTRHRAAIGITEVSDSVAVVISEERGEVSVAHRGRLYPAASESALLNRLHDLMEEKPEEKGREKLKEFIQLSGIVPIFLVIFAIWIVFAGTQRSLISLTVPLDFRNITQKLELKKASAESVEVQITGNPRLVRALKPEQVTAFLDLGDKQAGTVRIPLTTGNVILPLGLDVVKVSPSFIKVDLEGRVQKNLLVRPNLQGKPPDHYTIHSVIIDPPKILVEGPSSMMKGISYIQTQPIALEAMDYSQGSDPSYTVEQFAEVVFSPASIRSVEGIKRVKVTFNFDAVKTTPAKKPPEKKSP